MSIDIKELAKLTMIFGQLAINSTRATADLSQILLDRVPDLSQEEKDRLLIWTKIDLARLKAVQEALDCTEKKLE